MTRLLNPETTVRWRPFTGNVFTRIGASELDYDAHERLEHDRSLALAQWQPGLVVSRNSDGSLGTAWAASEDGSNAGQLLFGDSNDTEMLFIGPAGDTVLWPGASRPQTGVAPRTLGLTVPNDGVWRTVVVRPMWTPYQRGTITFTSGSTTITGTGTEFTKFAGRTTNFSGTSPQAPGTLIRVDAADNTNLGATAAYELATITNDTSATLVTAPSYSGTVPYSIRGSYLSSAPSTASDRDIYQRIIPEFELVTRTREPAATDLIICDVYRSGGTLTILDRRETNLAVPTRAFGRYPTIPRLVMRTSPAVTNPWLALSVWQTSPGGTGSTTTDGDGALSACRGKTGTLLYAFTTATDVDIWEWDALAAEGISTSRHTRVATGLVGEQQSTSIVHVPTGPTTSKHMIFYSKADKKFYSRTSTDNGATWGSETLIMDPTVVHANNQAFQPSAMVLMSGRVVVYFGYYDNALSGSEIRMIYSDDYGTTWETNGGEATQVFSVFAGSNVPRCAQDPITKRVWLSYVGSTELYVTSGPPDGIGPFEVGTTLTRPTGYTVQTHSMWVGPSGHAIVVYDLLDSGVNLRLVTSTLGLDSDGVPVQVSHEMIRYVESDASLGSQHEAWPTLVQSRGGQLDLVYITVDIGLNTDSPTIMSFTVADQSFNVGPSSLT